MTSKNIIASGYHVSSLGCAAVDALIQELTLHAEDAYSRELGVLPKALPVYRLYTSNGVTTVIVPKFFGLKRFGLPDGGAWEAPVPDRCFPSFNGVLRSDEQVRAVTAYLKAALDPLVSGGIITLPCGGGKTVVALRIAASLGVKTMIIVHKEFLIEQWRERIAQFLPDARVGLVKAAVVDVANKDIVMASLQSLSMKKYPPETFEDIGLLVVDECHRIGSEVFSRALFKVTCRYSLGLSATLERKDGMTKAIIHHLGPPVVITNTGETTGHVVATPSKPVVTVHIVRYDDDAPAYCRDEVTYRKGPDGQPKKFANLSATLTNVCRHVPRTARVVSLIVDAIEHAPTRKVLVLSDRKDQLCNISHMLDTANISNGFYWGESKSSDLQIVRTKQVICATFPYAAEGMDIPELDTLVLASPKSDVVQSCGRILRSPVATNLPVIYDIVDTFSGIFRAQARKRQNFYRSQQYRIETRSYQPIKSSAMVTNLFQAEDK